MNSTFTAPRAIPALLFVFLVFLLMGGCAGSRSADPSVAPSMVDPEFAAAPDSVSDLPGFKGRIYQDGRVFIAGQPDEEALRALPGRAISAVINLRLAKEMADTSKVAFDEAALVDSLGLDYLQIPMGDKENPYNPAAVEAFAKALESHPGPVLVHCASGGRASHLWAAYLVRYRGWTIPEAYARGEAIGIRRTPFSQMLDTKLKMVQDD